MTVLLTDYELAFLDRAFAGGARSAIHQLVADAMKHEAPPPRGSVSAARVEAMKVRHERKIAKMRAEGRFA